MKDDSDNKNKKKFKKPVLKVVEIEVEETLEAYAIDGCGGSGY